MKTCKTIIGGIALISAVVIAVLYFVTKSDPSGALAVKLFYPEDVKGVDSSVWVALAVSLVALAGGGIVSLISRNTDATKYNVIMIILGAVAFLVALMYSLLVPALLYVAVIGIVSLMFAVSYGCLYLDYSQSL